MIILGGNCEPWSAFRKLNFKTFASPFDWFGIPTSSFPALLQDGRWCEDSFALENVFLYNSLHEGYIGVCDIKYKIRVIHLFKQQNGRNYKTLVAEQLPHFRKNLIKRWESLKEVVATSDFRPNIVYREYDAYWDDLPIEGSLQKAYEALISFAPNAHVTIVTEKDVTFEKATVVRQPSLGVEYFKVEPVKWVPAWRFITENEGKLELGKSYGPFVKKV